MRRKGFLSLVGVLLAWGMAGSTWGSISILSESYHVRGDALHYNSGQTLSYDLTSSTAPAFGELIQPFDDEGFNSAGPYLLSASSRAARYREGRDMVFLVEQNPFDSNSGYPSYRPAEAQTRADLAVHFMPSASQHELHIEALSNATQDGIVLATLTDLNTGQSWSLMPYEWPGDYTGTTRTTVPVDPAHTYQLGLQALSIEWVPSSVLVRVEEFTAPAPNATALVALGVIGILTWRRTQRPRPL